MGSKIRRQDLPGLFVAAIVCIIMVGAIYLNTVNYMDTSSSCNGIVVRDYMGQPACVQNPGVMIRP